MQPNELTPDSFKTYPTEARSLASRHVELLRQLPLSFLPLLLREVIAYDWKFPIERAELEKQIAFLQDQPEAQLQVVMTPFRKLTTSQELDALGWVNQPGQFSEHLSAYLWSTHQIDAFREASVNYIQLVNSSVKTSEPTAPRLGMVLIGQHAEGAHYQLFRYLKPHGVHYTNVLPGGGQQLFFDTLLARATKYPVPFGHWYIDGGQLAASHDALTCVSYRDLRPVSDALLVKMTKIMQPGGGGPEVLRTELAAMKPEDIGMPNGNAILNRFQLSLLTEGSGTQIFSTTFVQWAAREALRRAQPYTLLARFAPRQREASVGMPRSPKADPPVDTEGSLVDADMAAYYTWINQQRLIGAAQASFIVWFEGHNQALAIAPSLRAATQENRPTALNDILKQV
jgi:hypothetical protein